MLKFEKYFDISIELCEKNMGHIIKFKSRLDSKEYIYRPFTTDLCDYPNDKHFNKIEIGTASKIISDVTSMIREIKINKIIDDKK